MLGMWWTLEIEGGPRRVNHAAVSVRDNYVFSFGGYCTGEEYFKLEKMDINIFVLSKYHLRVYGLCRSSYCYHSRCFHSNFR